MTNPRPAMAMGLETEYSIYASKRRAADPTEDLPTTSECTDALIAEAFADPRIMGPQVYVTGGRPHGQQWLRNGARLYNDVSAPEYSTPECFRPDILVIHDQAGMVIEQMAAESAGARLGFPLDVYKKNSDGRGHTYGCHENYGITARLFGELVKGEVNVVQHLVATFLIIRQVLCGAGKVGVEGHNESTPFQLSQRMDFVTRFRSPITTSDRPILNERDEPHANAQRWQRLHYIMGDANMTETATYLKTGLTALLLLMFQDDSYPQYLLPAFRGEFPRMAQLVSWDPEMERIYPVGMTRRTGRETETELSAPDMLAIFLDRLEAYVQERTFDDPKDRAVYADVVSRAQKALGLIRNGQSHRLYGVLDWPTKRGILEHYLRTHSRTWDEARKDKDLRKRMRAIADHAFTSLDRENGLYFRLLREGAITRIVSDKDIRLAVSVPPPGRAQLRTMLVERYLGRLQSIDWDVLVFRGRKNPVTFKLLDPMATVSDELAAVIAATKDPDDLSNAMRTLRRRNPDAVRRTS